jgi:hypothetical protein
MDVRFVPQPWVRPVTPQEKRRRSPYRSSYTQTLARLEDELNKLQATEILIECSFSHEQIRLDGWPRAGQRPRYNGVVISFNLPGVGRVEYPCDSCLNFEDNIHSIALTLESLRALERYGAVGQRQQYTGFRAIGSGNRHITTRDEAEVFLRSHAGLGDGLNLRDYYRAAMKKLHPDQGGARSEWDRLVEAKDVLGL